MSRTLRHILPILLLAIYVPTVVMSSLHVHHETADTLDDCQLCFGHIEKAHHHECDCLYCHFFHQHYFGESNKQADIIRPVVGLQTFELAPHTEVLCYGVSQLRAPPVA